MKTVTVSRKHKVVAVPLDPAVTNLFPSANTVDLGGVAHIGIPHQPTETFLLRKLGYDVPSPILTHYAFPHPAGKLPFNVQRLTCALFTLNPRAYCLNGMGTGKTKCPLWAWDYLRSHGLAGKLLVAAPLSTLNFTWMKEIFETLPHRKAVVLHGTRDKRLARLADPDAEIFVINHDGLKHFEKEILARSDIDTLAIDELANFRAPSTDRTKSARRIVKSMKWAWGMGGSPMPKAPTDVWAQCSIVTPNTVPQRFTHFRDQLMIKSFNGFNYTPKPDAAERAFDAMQPAVRFTLEDVTELPECIGLDPMRIVDVDMGPTQAKVYDEMRKKCISLIQNQQITAVNAGALMSKLLQVSTGWVYTADHRVVPLDNDKRIDALIDAIQSTDRKCLVWVPFKHALAGISAALIRVKIDHDIVSGDVSPNKRNEIFNLFQNTSKLRVLAAHPACASHGLTLTAADTSIWFAPITDYGTYEQANHRIKRVGQKHKQLYWHLCSTPVERRVYKMLETKGKAQFDLLSLFEADTVSNPQR
jgi:SNF2 family DNA or RNA helicase